MFNSADTSIAFSSAVPEVQSKIVEIETGDTLLINIGISGLTFNPNDDLIVSRVGELGFLSHQTYITNVLDGQLIATIDLFGSYTPPIFDRKGDLLVVEGVDNNAPNIDEAENRILFFNLGELIDQVETDASHAVNTIIRDSKVTALSFSPNYQILAVGEADGDLSLWGVPID